LSDGTLDKSRKETEYELDCSTQEKCDYLYDRSESYVDNSSNGLCRTCTRETYVYSCYPSGAVDKTKVRESVSCTNYEKCDAKFPTASATNTDFFGFDTLTLFAILLLFVLAILVFFLFGKKKSDEDKQHDDGQTGNEQNQF
jgi:hypothetical protein